MSTKSGQVQPATALAWAERAAAVFARLNVPIGTSIGTATAYVGRIDDGVGYNERNWESVLQGRNPLIMGILGHELTLTLALARDVRRSIEWGERIWTALMETTKNPPPVFEANILRPLVLAYSLSGAHEQAARACERVQDIQTHTLLGCMWEDGASVGLHCLRRGDADRARTVLEEALRTLGPRNQVAAISGCACALGALELSLGRHRKAQSLLGQSLEICRNGGNVLFQLWVLPTLAAVYLEAGRLGEARRCVEDATALMVPGRNWYGLPAGVDLVRAMLATAERRWDEAERTFGSAVEVNRRYGLPFDEARALAAWGRMHLARGVAGDRARARDRLGKALETFERLEATREIPKLRELLGPLQA